LLPRAHQTSIDLGHFFDPPPTLAVLEREHGVHGPVEVVSEVGYLLVELGEGVA